MQPRERRSNRHPVQRLGALLVCVLALWAMVGEVHAADCPNHASSGAAQHDESAGHGHAPATSAGQGSDAGHDHEACTCIGSCHVGAAAGLAASGGALPVLALGYPQRTFAVFAVEPRRERVPYLLPYATSPPA